MNRVHFLATVLIVLICSAAIILHADSPLESIPNPALNNPKSAPPSTPAIQPKTIPKHPSVVPTALVTQQTEHQMTKYELPVSAIHTGNFEDPITGMKFVLIPGGCFQMGNTHGDVDEKPPHQVCLDAFFIGRFEVTQNQWQRVMGSTPFFFSSCGGNCPVENVSWNDTRDFIRKLNTLSSKNYRLPTEAEWEYACRGGRKNESYCGGNNVDTVAWYDKNSNSKPHPVGQKLPNGFGLYDMSGNVWEWVNDRFEADYYENSPRNNPDGSPSGSTHVIRGGSWYNDSGNVGASIRGKDDPANQSINLGFRLAAPAR